MSPPKAGRAALAVAALLTLVTAVIVNPECRRRDSLRRAGEQEPGCVVLAGHDNWVHALAFSPDGSVLASGGAMVGLRGEARVWDVATGRPRAEIPGLSGGVYALAFAPDGRTLATGGWDATVRFWDVGTGRHLGSVTGPVGRMAALGYPPGGHTPTVFTIDNGAGTIWEATTDRDTRPLSEFADAMAVAAFSPDGRHLALLHRGTDTDRIAAHVRDVVTGHERTFPLPEMPTVSAGVAISCDGCTLAVGGADRTVVLWDLETGEPRCRLRGHDETVACLMFSPDGRMLATGGTDRAVWVWDVGTGRPLAVLRGHTGSVYCLAFSPDGRRLASGGFDKTVRVWDLTTVQSAAGCPE